VLHGGIENDFATLKINSLKDGKLVARDFFDKFDFTLEKQ
jgi:hypothetical protein